MPKGKKKRYYAEYVNDKHNRKRIEPTFKDVKFIEVCELIVSKNQEAGIEPSNFSSLGKRIYPPNRSIVNAVRKGIKHAPDTAVSQLGLLFGIDLNYFHREGVPIYYNPKSTETVKNNIKTGDNAVASTGDNASIYHAGSGKIQGLNSGNGQFTNYVVKAKNLIAQVPSELRADYGEVFERIQAEFDLMQERMLTEIRNNNDERKRTADIYERQLKEKNRRCEKLEKDLERALEKMQEYMDRYITSVNENQKLRDKSRKK